MYRYIWKIKLSDTVTEEEFINHWRESSAVLQEYPGAKGTHLHRMRDEPRTFFAVAEWESQEARDAMQAEIDAGQTERAKRWQKFAKNQAFGIIDSPIMGEELDVVLPNKQA